MFALIKTADIFKCEILWYESVILAMKTGYNLNILQSVESDKEILDKEVLKMEFNQV